MASLLSSARRLIRPILPLLLWVTVMQAPVAGAVLTRANRTDGTSAQPGPATAAGQADTPPTETTEALTGSEPFRTEVADLLRHATTLLRGMQPKEYPAGLQNTIALLMNGRAATDFSSWRRLTQQLVSADPGLSAVVLSCLSLSVLVPLVAVAICCRRVRSQPEPSRQECSGYRRCRANCNIAVIVLALCIIFCGAALLLAAAVLIRSGLRQSGSALDSALTSVQTVTMETGTRLTHLLTSDMKTAVRNIQRLMEDTIHQGTEQITLRLANQSGMTETFKSLFKLDSGLQTVTAGFVSLSADLNNLTSGWPDLVLRLADLRTDLERAASLCADEDQHLCAALSTNELALAKLNISTGVLSPRLSVVRRYRSVDLPALAETAQTSITALANSLQDSIATVRPGISRELHSSVQRAERYLAGTRPGLRRLLDHLRSLADRSRRQPLVTERTATAIWSSAFALPGLILVVTALLYGAVVGAYFPSRTSSRPHRYTIYTIRIALLLLVLGSVLVWAAAAAGALAAGLTQVNVCPETGHRRPAEVARLAHRMGLRGSLHPSATGPVTPSLTQTLRQCATGDSLLTVFDLGQPAEVATAAQLSSPRLRALIGPRTGRTVTDGQSDLLAGKLGRYLQLASSLVDTDLSTVKSELERPSLMSGAPAVLSQLSSALSQLSSDSDRDRLRQLADRLAETVTGPLYTLQKQKARLVVQVATFDMSLMSLRGQVTGLLGQIAEVDRFLSTNASDVIQKEEANFRSQLTARLQRFSNHVRTVLQRAVGCRAVWEAFQLVFSATCDRLLGGVSAYWLGCLLTGGLLLLLAAAALPLLTRLAGRQLDPSGEPAAEDNSKLWRSSSPEMQQSIRSSAQTKASGQSDGGGRW